MKGPWEKNKMVQTCWALKSWYAHTHCLHFWHQKRWEILGQKNAWKSKGPPPITMDPSYPHIQAIQMWSPQGWEVSINWQLKNNNKKKKNTLIWLQSPNHHLGPCGEVEKSFGTMGRMEEDGCHQKSGCLQKSGCPTLLFECVHGGTVYRLGQPRFL